MQDAHVPTCVAVGEDPGRRIPTPEGAVVVVGMDSASGYAIRPYGRYYLRGLQPLRQDP